MEQVDEVMTALTRRNLDQLSLNLVRNFGKIVGSTINTECLFWNQNFFSRASKLVGDLKGAENGKKFEKLSQFCFEVE